MPWSATALVLSSALVIWGGAATAAAPDTERQGELRHLLKHDCGSCHGLARKGGLGPPLQPDHLKGKSVAFLAQAILDGRPGTAMPPWRALLTEQEADWLARELKQGEVSQ